MDVGWGYGEGWNGRERKRGWKEGWREITEEGLLGEKKGCHLCGWSVGARVNGGDDSDGMYGDGGDYDDVVVVVWWSGQLSREWR